MSGEGIKGGVMESYALYCLENFKLVQCERFTAASDEAAVTEAMRRQGRYAAELWCDDDHRRVREFGVGVTGAYQRRVPTAFPLP